MIHEVDHVLVELLRRDASVATDIHVAVDAPTRSWMAGRNAPTVNLYLYDIREDVPRRQQGTVNAYGPDGAVQARHDPPRYLSLSYLVTAWTQSTEDDHRLLSNLLVTLLRHATLPPGLLVGSLATLGLPVPMTVGRPAVDLSPAEIWTALGVEVKPGLFVTVEAPVQVGSGIGTSPPARGNMRLAVAGDAGGRTRQPVESAEVDRTHKQSSRVSMRRVRNG